MAKNEGFFSTQEVGKQRAIPPSRKRAAASRKLDCETCGLYKNVQSPKMDARGQGKRGILVLAEAPGDDEDAKDDILSGPAGQVLRDGLAEIGVDLEEDCLRLNGVNCWTGKDAKGKNKTPTPTQIACCRKIKVNPAIEEFKPKVILLFGNTAIESFWGENHSDLKINKFRGKVFPNRRTGAWVVSLYHSAFLIYKGGEKNPSLMALWRRDLQIVSEVLERDPPEFRDPEQQIECITDYDRVIEVLDLIQEWANLIVFDYETSGLSPFAPGHKIHSISVVPYIEGHLNQCYSFPLQYPEAWTKDQLAKIARRWWFILATHRIKKVAHHVQFEDLWSRIILDVMVDRWHWCTMVNQHIIGNTRGTTGLKFQAWHRFDVIGYDDEFKQYVEAKPTAEERKAGKTRSSSHDFNRVHEMPLDRLLLYGGYDGILESWLYDEQQKEIPPKSRFDNARRFYHKAIMVLCDQQEEGVPIDEEYYEREGQALSDRVEQIRRALLKSREGKLFHQKEGRPIKLGSHDDLKLLLFKHLGKAPIKMTTGGNASTDAEVLEKMGLKFTDELLKMKKLEKIRGTYFDQIVRESVNGKVHPHTNLNLVQTYRPSIDRPNLANIPKREKEAKLLVRRGLRVPLGYKMAQPDYAGIEVHGLCWYSEDPELLRYLNDPTTDMHRDQAQNIFNIPHKMWIQLDKTAVYMLRFFIKNKWVFPQFYGSWHEPCAESIWRACANLPIGDGEGTTVKQHLGMSFTRFLDKMREYEGDFWSQYSGVQKWQENQITTYREQGYIETKIGFRYGGWLTRNQLYNYPIQGTAFHVLLWAMIQIHGQSVAEEWLSYVMWQVYDAMPLAIHPSEQQYVLSTVDDIMVDKAQEYFPWINTPLKVEMEITGVDGTYADLVEFEDARDGYSDEDAA